MVLAITFLAMLPLYWLISKRILYNSGAGKFIDHPANLPSIPLNAT